MKMIKSILGAVALALCASTAFAQTPAALTSTPSPTQALSTPAATASPVINKTVGTSAAWTSKIAFGSCILNPASIPAGRSVIHNCTVTGAATTDKVFVNAQPPNNAGNSPFTTDECFYVQGAKVISADTIQFRINNRDMYGVQAAIACDPPALTIDYMLVRPNKQY